MAIKTKGEIINEAFAQLRISGLTVNATPKEEEKALGRLEDMAAEYESRNICIDYLFEEDPDPSSSTGVDRAFNFMLSTNLAVRMIPDFGKKSAQNDSLTELKGQATQSLSNASARTAIVNQTNYPEKHPVGMGNTFRWNRWRRFYREKEDAPISCETEVMPLNVAKSFSESWIDQLADGETITDFTITESDGLELQSNSINADANGIDYRVKSIKCGAQCVTIEVITDLSTPDNFDVRIVNFNVLPNDTLGG